MTSHRGTDVVIEAGYEQEQREEFIMSKIRAGSSILGVYPPDDHTLQQYSEWKRA